MNNSDIDSVYNNMLALLKEELVISQTRTDKSRLSYRLRNIVIFMLYHYNIIVMSNKDLIETHMSKYYIYAIETINTEYNRLSSIKLSVDEQKTLCDYKKTMDYMEQFMSRSTNNK